MTMGAMATPTTTNGFGEVHSDAASDVADNAADAADTGAEENGSREAMLEAAKAAFKAPAAKAAPKPKGEPAASLAAEAASKEPVVAEPAKEEPATSLAEEVADAEAGGATEAEVPAPAAHSGKTESKLRQLLSSKETDQGVRERAQKQAQAILQQAQEQAVRIQQNAVEAARVEARAFLEQQRGGKPDIAALIAQQADENDPLVQLAKRFENAIAERDKVIEGFSGKVKTLEARDEERARYFAQVAATSAEEKFLKVGESEAYEAARILWDGPELLKKAHEVIASAGAKAREKGEEFRVSDEELLAHLNEEATDRLIAQRDKINKLLQKVGAEAASAVVAKPAGQAPAKPKTNGTKAPAGQGQGQRATLSTSGASERRSPTKEPEREMSDREFRAYAADKLRSTKTT